MGMGMVQSIVAAMLDVVPPLIPPPAWNNMPLPCAPMITGLLRLFHHGSLQYMQTRNRSCMVSNCEIGNGCRMHWKVKFLA